VFHSPRIRERPALQKIKFFIHFFLFLWVIFALLDPQHYEKYNSLKIYRNDEHPTEFLIFSSWFDASKDVIALLGGRVETVKATQVLQQGV
jgi:hypothetical protein